jgi:DNA-binding MarR family transcriptional regulator
MSALNPTPTGLDMLQLLGEGRIGHEARAASGDHLALKVWLRLLACSTQIENEIRKRLRSRFGMTLARFDYLAQLYRHPAGLRMNVLSRYLMVTGGNVTGLTDELAKDGLVVREDDPSDRRSFRITLTDLGRSTFERIAAAHEGWLVELFASFGEAGQEALFEHLGRLRVELAGRKSATVDRAAIDPAGKESAAIETAAASTAKEDT